MLHKNKVDSQDVDSVSRNESMQLPTREIPKEKDGANNPWKAITILKQEYNQKLDEAKRQRKLNTTKIMK